MNDKASVLDLFDPSDYPAIGYDLIIDLKAGDQFLELLFLTLLRQDHQKVEDAEDEYKRQKRPDDAAGRQEKSQNAGHECDRHVGEQPFSGPAQRLDPPLRAGIAAPWLGSCVRGGPSAQPQWRPLGRP